jgi:hypothetical protein
MAYCVRPTPVLVAEPDREAEVPGMVTGATTNEITAERATVVTPGMESVICSGIVASGLINLSAPGSFAVTRARR